MSQTLLSCFESRKETSLFIKTYQKLSKSAEKYKYDKIEINIHSEAILCRFEAIGFLCRWNYWQLWKVYLGNIPSRYLAGCLGYISRECAIYTLAQALTRAANAGNRQIRMFCNTFFWVYSRLVIISAT